MYVYYILFSYCTCLCCDIYLSNHIMCIYMFGVIAHVIYFPSFFFSTKHIKIVSIFYHFFFYLFYQTHVKENWYLLHSLTFQSLFSISFQFSFFPTEHASKDNGKASK